LISSVRDAPLADATIHAAATLSRREAPEPEVGDATVGMPPFALPRLENPRGEP
jgi:hypothetical protein